MHRRHTRCLFGGALIAAGIPQAATADTYRLDGPSAVASPSTLGYAWDGGYMAPFRAALENVSNFSNWRNYSSVQTSIVTGEFDFLNGLAITRPDGIISPWWADADCSGYEAYVATYHFLVNGADLFLFNDDSYHDKIGAYLGIPTQNYASSFTFNGVAFPFDGPFGTTASVNMSGSIGFLDPVDVAVTGGQVLAVNGAGQIVVAYWDRGDYAPGAGRMLIVTDVNTIGDFFGTAQYAPLNDNGRFALNLVAGMIGNFACNPADIDGNGVINLDDIGLFVEAFLGGCL